MDNTVICKRNENKHAFDVKFISILSPGTCDVFMFVTHYNSSHVLHTRSFLLATILKVRACSVRHDKADSKRRTFYFVHFERI